LGVGRKIVVSCVAALLGGCGGSSPRPPEQAAPKAGPTSVSLKLLDGGEAARLRACDVLTNYPTYDYGGFVRYDGRITPRPSGNWSLQVKLKRCVPNGYSESFMEIVDGRPDGTFSGMVPKLNPNEFYVQAQYRPAAGKLYLSRPEYFRVVRG
jgi:hypothetical protein